VRAFKIWPHFYNIPERVEPTSAWLGRQFDLFGGYRQRLIFDAAAQISCAFD
jgi:hypothetical protein